MLIITVVLAVMSCKKECHQHQHQHQHENSHEMIVTWNGEPEVDGCGWLLYEEDKPFHPTNLPEEFREDQLQVTVQYTRVEPGFYCGRSRVPIPSIRISEINGQRRAIRLLNENEWDRISMDMFAMDTAYVKGDSLHLTVSYSGGCARHRFDLWRLPVHSPDTKQFEVLLSHTSNDDPCDAWLTSELSFSLVPIRVRGKYAVTFLLRGPPVMSAYFGEFTYRY